MSKIVSRLVRISIHAPVKGATKSESPGLLGQIISIHAPVKGATRPPVAHPTWPEISIHAPVKGATFGVGVHAHVLADFNPRSREGSDWLTVPI